MAPMRSSRGSKGNGAALPLLAALAVVGLLGVPAVAKGLGSKPHEAAGMTELDYALMDATSEGDVEEMKRLLANGANVNAKNTEGETPLHVSGIWGKVEPLQLLLEAGASVNVQATGEKSLGLAPLHWFTHPGYAEGVEVLLKAGAKVNMIVRNEGGVELTALDIARQYINSQSDKHGEVERLLLKFGGKTRDELPGAKKSEL